MAGNRSRFGLRLGLAIAFWAASFAGFAAPPLPQPSWKQLSAEQQRVLAPLAGDWDQMEGVRRKKWLGIAERYKAMGPEEQARLQQRMTSWVKLSPEERKRARDKYLELQKAPPERKETVRKKWETYKELPEAEKQRLKAEAARKSPPPPKPVPKPAPSRPAAVKPPSPGAPAGTPPAAPAGQVTPGAAR